MVKERAWASTPIAEDVVAAPAAVKSAARAFRIVEFFDEIRRSARGNEIAERLKIPQSSTSVLLNSLVRLGYLDFDVTSKTYLPSIRTAVLATWRETGCFRNGSMLALLEHLAFETGVAACLVVREGIVIRYLHIVQTSRIDSIHIPLSVRRFAVKHAAGIVLIADMPEAQIRALAHRTRAEEPPEMTGTSFAEVMERVKRGRANGYYLSAGLVNPKRGGVAVALPASITGGWQEMAISVAGARNEIVEREDELVAALINAVRRIEPTFDLKRQSPRERSAG